jgi:hypothetical protein
MVGLGDGVAWLGTCGDGVLLVVERSELAPELEPGRVMTK